MIEMFTSLYLIVLERSKRGSGRMGKTNGINDLIAEPDTRGAKLTLRILLYVLDELMALLQNGNTQSEKSAKPANCIRVAGENVLVIQKSLKNSHNLFDLFITSLHLLVE